jgi:hypothetical protein
MIPQQCKGFADIIENIVILPVQIRDKWFQEKVFHLLFVPVKKVIFYREPYIAQPGTGNTVPEYRIIYLEPCFISIQPDIFQKGIILSQHPCSDNGSGGVHCYGICNSIFFLAKDVVAHQDNQQIKCSNPFHTSKDSN